MQIPGAELSIRQTPLYDNQGNVFAIAEASRVGYVDGQRDGGINAGGIATIRINGADTVCVLMFTLKTEEGGRQSGWAPLSSLSPRAEIEKVQRKIKARIDQIRPDESHRRYQARTVQEVPLPKEAEEWYLMPGRAAHKSQGKAKYYFARRGHLYGLINIPETGHQRYGVTYDVAPVGSTFFVDRDIAEIKVPIYPPDSTRPSKYALRLVYGYFTTSAGEKRPCWANAACLR
jgi:hypothetical protein